MTIPGGFGTYDSLMEPILEQTGFETLEITYRDGGYAAYTCKRRGK